MPSDKETYIKKQENDLRQTKATRNKTIDLSLEESKELIDRCLCPSNTDAELSLSGIVDRTLLGDCFDLLPRLPKNSFDLAVIDPPYNMRKSFNGNVFSKKSFEEYEEYTRRWVSLIAPLMKKNASVYVCCDWESSLVIGKVLFEFFTVRSRRTSTSLTRPSRRSSSCSTRRSSSPPGLATRRFTAPVWPSRTAAS